MQATWDPACDHTHTHACTHTHKFSSRLGAWFPYLDEVRHVKLGYVVTNDDVGIGPKHKLLRGGEGRREEGVKEEESSVWEVCKRMREEGPRGLVASDNDMPFPTE